MGATLGRAVHSATMWLLTLPLVLYWLPFLRSLFDGVSYEWGNTLFGRTFHGAGTSGDFWFPTAGVVIGVILLWSGWRGPDRIFRPLALAVAGLWFADAIHTIASGSDMIFEGATLGVSLSVGKVALAYYAILLALMVWSFRQPSRASLALTWANYVLLAIVVVLLPVQYFLLSAGRGQETSDLAGVIITICQWLLLGAGFSLGSFRRRA